MSVLDSDVVIVGGGVAGLAASLALSCLGLRSLVVEARTERGDIDRGDVLHSPALAALEKWGCGDLIASSGALSIRSFSMVDETGQSLLELDTVRDVRPSANLFILQHSAIEELLERAAVRTGMVTVLRGERCRNLLEERGRVAGIQCTRGSLRAPLTLFATGAESQFRKDFGDVTAGRDYKSSFWNLQCEGNAPLGDRAAYVLGERGVMITAPLPRGQFRLGFQVDRAASNDFNWSAEAGRRLVLLKDCSLRIVSAHRYRVSRFCARHFAKNGAALVGDVAHTTHPAGAKGMNLAIRDAEVLATLLGSQSYTAAGVDRALSQYETQRRRAVTRVLQLTHALGIAGEMRQPLLIRGRNRLVSLAGRLRSVREYLLGRVCWDC